MILNIDVPVGTNKNRSIFYADTDKAQFPIMTIDKESYIVGAKIHSGINFHWDAGTYSLQIGKYCAIAEDVIFMIDLNHNYKGLCVGCVPELEGEETYNKINQTNQIIIENDCWIGHGVTIMDGVTIHNGAVVGANALVTKDVPPYAIVGGNPAKIIGYRFDQDIIDKLLNIAWWDWSCDVITQNKEWMLGDVAKFADHFYNEDKYKKTYKLKKLTTGQTFLFYVDIDEPYSLWKKVIKQFAEKFDNTDNELVLYINPFEQGLEGKAQILFEELENYTTSNIYVNICTDMVLDDSMILQDVDYYISNRSGGNIYRMCKAHLYGVKCLAAVDSQIFYDIEL